MSSLSSCTPPGMGSLKKQCFKVIIISRLLIFDIKNQVYCFNQGLWIAVHGLYWISPLLFYWRFMQGRQQPGQEKRYFLEQEESTGYLPVFRNIRLEKNMIDSASWAEMLLQWFCKVGLRPSHHQLPAFGLRICQTHVQETVAIVAETLVQPS